MKEDLVVADKNAPIAKAINNKKRRNKKIQDDRIEAIQEFYDKCIYICLSLPVNKERYQSIISLLFPQYPAEHLAL